MPLDNNTYYPSGNITIFPSSNAVDVGKLFTEDNGRGITINITEKNYVVKPKDGYDIYLNNDKIKIKPGRAIINGFEVETDAEIEYKLPTDDNLYTGNKYTKYQGYALLCLQTKFDTMGNISGNIMVGDTWYCEGIVVTYPTTEDFEANENEYLLLGGIKTDGTVLINSDKFTRITADSISINLQPNERTGLPPEQSTNLNNFINNILKGYWLSKAGDNQYGKILFRPMPEGYNKPGFDYKTEKSLDNFDDVTIELNTSKDVSNTLGGYITISDYLDIGNTYYKYHSTTLDSRGLVVNNHYEGSFGQDDTVLSASFKITNVYPEYKTNKKKVGFISDSDVFVNGYIYAGENKDVTAVSNITVPDFAGEGSNRKLKIGDIYGNQVWGAVYNDYAEIFDLSEDTFAQYSVGLLVAQCKNEPTKFTIADRRVNNNIIGVVSENPGFCTGGKDCKNGVPVALVGRVKVKYEGKIRIGDYVGLSKKYDGYVTRCSRFSKYCCGKMLNRIDNNIIEILVK